MADMPETAEPATEMADLVPTAEATAIFGLKNPSTVVRMVYEHKLTPAMRVGAAYLFHRADIERLRDERAAKAAVS